MRFPTPSNPGRNREGRECRPMATLTKPPSAVFNSARCCQASQARCYTKSETFRIGTAVTTLGSRRWTPCRAQRGADGTAVQHAPPPTLRGAQGNTKRDVTDAPAAARARAITSATDAPYPRDAPHNGRRRPLVPTARRDEPADAVAVVGSPTSWDCAPAVPVASPPRPPPAAPSPPSPPPPRRPPPPRGFRSAARSNAVTGTGVTPPTPTAASTARLDVHSHRVPSSDADATSASCAGLHAAQLTLPECPYKRPTRRVVSRCHSKTVLSSEPDTTHPSRWPPNAERMTYRDCCWPSNVRVKTPDAMSHSCTLPPG